MELNKPCVLVINIGSSSHKCALFTGDATHEIWQGKLSWNANFQNSLLTFKTASGYIHKDTMAVSNSEEGLVRLLQTLWEGPHPVIANKTEIDCIGHRVVHGGVKFRSTSKITPEVKKDIQSLTDLAPLHNLANLKGIEIADNLFPKATQFAVFDTAFHATLPDATVIYPGPLAWTEKGIQRYGFHGINFQYCSRKVLELAPNASRTVICHLGSGSSLCAIKDGQSIDTTMGFTPMEGLMMATRSGTIDPGILIYLMRHEKLNADAIEKMINDQSGLLGLAGEEDLRAVIQKAEKGEKQASTAIAVYLHRLCGFLGMMIASLQGLDAIVFTGGIGENSPHVRRKVCEVFSYLNVKIDEKRNDSFNGKIAEISTYPSKVKIFILPAQEEQEIARECFEAEAAAYPS